MFELDTSCVCALVSGLLFVVIPLRQEAAANRSQWTEVSCVWEALEQSGCIGLSLNHVVSFGIGRDDVGCVGALRTLREEDCVWRCMGRAELGML